RSSIPWTTRQDPVMQRPPVGPRPAADSLAGLQEPGPQPLEALDRRGQGKFCIPVHTVCRYDLPCPHTSL
ncbi:MAG: hypothetical protein WKF51_14750, partial [Geodermatophilaceae bacterium]